jgi:hypothetical protein
MNIEAPCTSDGAVGWPVVTAPIRVDNNEPVGRSELPTTIKLEPGVVHFASAPGEKPLTLYSFCRTTENVKLSLKDYREKLAVDLSEELI